MSPELTEKTKFLDKNMNLPTPLFVLQSVVSQCTACPALVESRKQTVFGEGNPDAEIMFVGESPGRHEDDQGRPFVGEAGKLLDGIIRACGWNRIDVYICNTINCRPPNNRTPTSEEISNCRGFLDKQIELVNPDYIILLGSVATQSILGTPVSQARGRMHMYNGRHVVATWHPASILYKQTESEVLDRKREVWNDMKIFLEFRKNALIS